MLFLNKTVRALVIAYSQLSRKNVVTEKIQLSEQNKGYIKPIYSIFFPGVHLSVVYQRSSCPADQLFEPLSARICEFQRKMLL